MGVFACIDSLRLPRLAEPCVCCSTMEPSSLEDRLASLEFSIRVLEHVRNSDHSAVVASLQSLSAEVASLQSSVHRLEGEIELLRFIFHQVLLRPEDTDTSGPYQSAQVRNPVDLESLD